MSNGQSCVLVFGVRETCSILGHICRTMQDKGECESVAFGKLNCV